MGRRRQKIQLELAFMTESRGEAPMAANEGTESRAAKHVSESPASTEHLMEEVCQRENLKKALQRVRSNKGSPGVDGMTVDELPGDLTEHWPRLRDSLLSGTYKPQPVARVEIPKPGSRAGIRQAVAQVTPSVLECRRDGERTGQSDERGHAARRSALAAAE